MIKLQLSPTIRLARANEFANQEAQEKLKQVENNNVVEGYRLMADSNEKYPHKFFAEININNAQLWALFSKLLLTMPDEICLITKEKEEDDVVWSSYEDKYTMHNLLEPYAKQLSEDGFLEFGIIYQAKNFLEEVYVKNAKYIQYWGMDETKFRTILHSFEVYEVQSLQFIDEYPMITEAYSLHSKKALDTLQLLDKIRIYSTDNSTDEDEDDEE